MVVVLGGLETRSDWAVFLHLGGGGASSCSSKGSEKKSDGPKSTVSDLKLGITNHV